MSDNDQAEYKLFVEQLLAGLNINQEAMNDANLEVTSWLLRGSDNPSSCTCCQGGPCNSQ